jgi:hypothetical protein
MKQETTHYSRDINGEFRNYHWSVRFDITDRYLGISQTHDDGTVERVLLSPKQVTAMLAFLKSHKRK